MKPLTDEERRVVILIKLYQKQHRHGPKWSWLMAQTGMSRRECIRIMRRLRKRRVIGYKDGVVESTYATKLGVTLALHPPENETPLDGALAEA